jgi:hypothetical protein
MSKTRRLLAEYFKRLVKEVVTLPIALDNSCEESLIIGPPKLPIELLIAVVSFVDGKEELCQLCQVSRFLREISEPILYQRHFRGSKFAQGDIRVLLGHPRFEMIINNIEILLGSWKYCSRLGPFHPERAKLGCSCSKIDSSLGMALNALLNLKTLQFHCALCAPGARQRHRWLTTMQTRVLHKLYFICQCSTVDEKELVEKFRAPCMVSVVSLGWYTIRGTPTSDGHLEAGIEDEKIFPNLRHIYYKRDDPTDLLLRYRPITRLYQWPMDQKIPTLEEQSDRSIYMNAEKSQDGTLHISGTRTKVLFPFRTLQHIGTFYLAASTSSVS